MAGTSFLHCRGYSLHEVLIAMGLSTLILVGMGLVLKVQNHAYRAQGAQIDTGRTLDTAMKQLQRDLQLAGAGLPPGTLPAIVPGNGDGNPVLIVRYLTDDPFVTRLTRDASNESNLFSIPPTAVRHFRRGDQVLVHQDGSWLVFRVEAVKTGTRPGLTPDPESLQSSPEPSDWLTLPRGSEVILLRDAEVQYWLDGDESGGRRLLRRRGTRERVLATGVQDIHAEYVVAAPAEQDAVGPRWTDKPTQGTRILAARVRLTVGRTNVRFTVTPRNLSLGSPS